MSKKQQPFTDKYTPLNEPAIIDTADLPQEHAFRSDEDNEAIVKQHKQWTHETNFEVAQELTEKEGLLFEYYDIECGDYLKLSHALMQDYIPGFQVRNKNEEKHPGRQSKWTDYRLLELYLDVEKLLKEKQHINPALTASSVIKELSSKYKANEKVLQNQYSESKHSGWVVIIEQLRESLKKDHVDDVDALTYDFANLIIEAHASLSR